MDMQPDQWPGRWRADRFFGRGSVEDAAPSVPPVSRGDRHRTAGRLLRRLGDHVAWGGGFAPPDVHTIKFRWDQPAIQEAARVKDGYWVGHFYLSASTPPSFVWVSVDGGAERKVLLR